MVQIARPGGVSVFMLAESWYANTVMHILGIHGFNTQLLLYEQVVGRALRKRSFDQNEEAPFNVEVCRHPRHPV
jgi:type III restriction enzyme